MKTENRKYPTEPQSVKTEDGKTAYNLAFQLAPCPFCGGSELQILEKTGAIFCKTCLTTGPCTGESPAYQWNEWYYRENGTSAEENIKRILEVVQDNADVEGEIYASVMTLRKAVSLLARELQK